MPHEKKVNVKSLPEITQVSKGDYLIIETDDSGTKIIDFENFVIDETHTTFEPLLSGLQVDLTSLSAQSVWKPTGTDKVYTLSAVGIGTVTPDYELDVAGNIGMNEYLYHNGDGDTYIKFAGNDINLVAGGKSALRYEASTGKIILNNTNQNVDLQVMADGGDVLLHTDAGTTRVGINTTSPGSTLTVAGDVSASGALSAVAVVHITNLPASDPGVVGQLYHTSGTVKISV